MARTSKIFRVLGVFTGVLAVILVTAFFVAQKKSKLIDKERFALVDSLGGNYIVRGNNPFAGDPKEAVFSYEQLTEAINGALTKQGKPALDDYYLIDLSLLDIDQYFLIQKERRFFEQRPELGEYLNISTVSPGILATSIDTGMAQFLTRGYNLANTELLEKIRALATQQRDKPVVVFVHCDAGRDRTGYVFSSYRMYFNGMTLRDAEAQNIEDAGRTSRDYYYNATRSFCRFLDRTRADGVIDRCAEPLAPPAS